MAIEKRDGNVKDPYRGYRFRVEIDGIQRAGFRECSGLDSTQDPVEYREGSEIMTVRKLPGLTKYSNISLKWGVTDNDKDLWEWRKQAAEGKLDKRKNVAIILIDQAGEDAIRWNLREAWPTKWTGPTFNATANEVAIHTLEIAHEGVERQ
jgi:phage tail-like protein